jgi:hypothetical protein
MSLRGIVDHPERSLPKPTKTILPFFLISLGF